MDLVKIAVWYFLASKFYEFDTEAINPVQCMCEEVEPSFYKNKINNLFEFPHY
jgi:hypothetical protein